MEKNASGMCDSYYWSLIFSPQYVFLSVGVYPLKPDLPAVGGFEGVGKVVEAGKEVTHLQPGDLVLPAINTLGKYI